MTLVLGTCVAGLIQVARAEAALGRLASDVEARQPSCLGAAAMRPGARPCVNPELAHILLPQPDLARGDLVLREDCSTSGRTLRMCTLGPETGYAKRLAALGDSHAAALLPAFEKIALTMNWRIDVATKNACYWTAALQARSNSANSDACQQWKSELNRRLAETEPYEAILVTHRVGAFQPEAPSEQLTQRAIVDGLIAAWQTQTARGTKIIAIRDNPSLGEQRVACVAQHLLQSNRACAPDRELALATFDGHIPATRAVRGSYLVDLSDYYCDVDRCLTIIGGVVVYRDGDHITATFARTLAPILLRELRKVLG